MGATAVEEEASGPLSHDAIWGTGGGGRGAGLPGAHGGPAGWEGGGDKRHEGGRRKFCVVLWACATALILSHLTMGLESTLGDQAAGKTNPAGRPSPLTSCTRGGRWGTTRLIKEEEERRLRGSRVGRLAGWTPGGEVPKKAISE